MPVTGRKPKAEDQRRNRVKPVHDWTAVLDVPYEGERPTLPRVPKATRDWWDAVTTLPHCALWRAGEWQFALATARIHAQFIGGEFHRAAELRQRERAMGTTADALRDLRIRYVAADKDEREEAGVTSLDDYRASLE